MPCVLVCGDINVDVTAKLAAPLQSGVDSLVPQMEQHLGGVGANVGIALARGGVHARLLGCAGGDAFGDFALERLRHPNLDTTYVQRASAAVNGMWLIAVNPDGQRTMIGSRGANQLLHFRSADAACLEGVDWVHAVGQTFLSPVEAESSRELLAEVRRRRIPVSFDVGNAPARQLGPVLLAIANDVDVLFISYDEAMAVTGMRERSTVLAALENLNARDVVLKLGERGCMIRDASAWREVPALRVSAMDTTGAGDAFAAAYIRARLRGFSPAARALLANAAGAAASCVIGAGENMPAAEAALKLLGAVDLLDEWQAVRDEILKKN